MRGEGWRCCVWVCEVTTRYYTINESSQCEVRRDHLKQTTTVPALTNIDTILVFILLRTDPAYSHCIIVGSECTRFYSTTGQVEAREKSQGEEPGRRAWEEGRVKPGKASHLKRKRKRGGGNGNKQYSTGIKKKKKKHH